MFCKNCGAKVSGPSVCQKCNTPAFEVKDDDNSSFYKNTVLDNNANNVSVDNPDLKGLGGWLVIVCLGLIYTLFTAVTSVYSDGVMFFNGTVESMSGIQGYAAALGFELLAFVILTILVIYILFLFFKKKKSFPRFFIYYVIFLAAYGLIDLFLLNSLNFPDSIKQTMQSVINETSVTVGRSFVFALIWGFYMKKSERVKLTFTK